MKKMAPTLYVSLLVIALCSLSECIQRRYHYINIEKTWTEAQRYCRENYTDLATVNNMNDMKQLMNTVNKQLMNTVNNNLIHVWIGLKNTGVYKWKWSLSDPVKYLNWETEPSDNRNNCAVMRNGTWRQQNCNDNMRFICYNGSSKTYIIETSNKTWREAQSFCRQYHTDLISVRNQTDNQLIQNIINNPETSVWIGLFRDSFEWSDNSSSTFRYWESGDPTFYYNGVPEECTDSAMNSGKWFDTSCNNSLTFVCHEDKLILIQKNLSWIEALRYCRENHVDLVSVDSEKIQLWVKAAVLHEASTAEVWLGLRHSCVVGIWFWMNGEIVCYENWAPGNETAVDDCEREVKSGAVQSEGDHLWINLPQSKQLNFICIKDD